MAEKKKASLRSKTSLNKRNNYIWLIGGLLLLILLALAFVIGGRYSRTIRDNARKGLMNEIKSVAEDIYEESGKYPSSVLFSKDQALVCEDIDCVQFQTVKIGRNAKSISGSNTKTSTKHTKYDYELVEDGYRLGYCDEDGNVQNYGKSQGSIILMCN